VSWKIEFRGHTLVETDVTVAHLSVIADIVGGDSWEHTNPMHSPRVLAAWVALTLAAGSGEPLADVVAFVTTVPLGELVDAVTSVDDAPLRAVPDTKAG
jgi:hypothetical protein